MNTYEKVLKLEHSGEGKVNRPGFSTLKTRRWKRLVGKQVWFKPKEKDSDPTHGKKHFLEDGNDPPPAKRVNLQPVEGVLYVPHTPNSLLKKQIEDSNKIWESNKWAGKVRICERLGLNMRETLSNPTPWKHLPCGRPECVSCGEKPGHCKKVGVTYRIQCQSCKSVGKESSYWGETSRSFSQAARTSLKVNRFPSSGSSAEEPKQFLEDCLVFFFGGI